MSSADLILRMNWVNPLVKLYLRYRLKYHSKEWNEIQIRGYVRGMNEDWIEVKR